MVHLRITGVVAVLYTYSDCTLLRSAAGRAGSAYGWLAAGCADAGLVAEVDTLEEGTWGEASLMGPALTSQRSEVRRLDCLPPYNM